MTNLTDKWKKGELPSGWYWVELKEGTFVDGKKSVILNYLFEFTNDFERHPYLVEQVLAPVPSYKEWKSSDGLILTLMDNIKDKSDLLQQEMLKNVELKGLLKSALSWLPDGSKLRGMRYAQLQSIKRRINQVLGEE